MTRKPASYPAEGGSYIRQPDGTLKRTAAVTPPEKAPEKTAEKPAPKTQAKPAVKED